MKYFGFIAAILLVVSQSCNRGKDDQQVPVVKVKKGDFIIDLVEEGHVESRSSINIGTPNLSWRFGMPKINMIVEDGTEVNKGDTVLMLDPTEVESEVLESEGELEIAKAELAKLKAQHLSAIKELETDLQLSEIDYQISQIRLELAEYEADVTRQEIELNLEKSKIALNKAREEIVNQKKIQKEEQQQSMLRIRQIELELEEAYEALEKMTVTSPASGLAILNINWNTRNKWQEGDQPWQGQALINLPDLSRLQAELFINEVDISKLKVGQSVNLRLDAFSDSVFSGAVVNVANLAQESERDSKIKIFPVIVEINGQSKKLLPGMTVSCQIEIDRIADVYFIPLEGLFQNNNSHFVYLKSGNKYVRRKVQIGPSNNNSVIIEDGLDENDEVALANPFEVEEEETDEETQVEPENAG